MAVCLFRLASSASARVSVASCAIPRRSPTQFSLSQCKSTPLNTIPSSGALCRTKSPLAWFTPCRTKTTVSEVVGVGDESKSNSKSNLKSKSTTKTVTSGTIPQGKLGDPIALSPGQYGEFTKKITLDDVITFSNLSGDDNPIHLDEEVASKTRFGRRIAHGMISASLFSTIFGSRLPGAIYLTQNLKFTAPVFLDDVILARVTVKSIDHSRKIVTCLTVCQNQNGVTVIEGEAKVLIPLLETEKVCH